MVVLKGNLTSFKRFRPELDQLCEELSASRRDFDQFLKGI